MNAENNGFDCLQTLHFHFQVKTETSTALTDDQFNPSRTREPNILCDQIDRCHSVDCLDRLSKGTFPNQCPSVTKSFSMTRSIRPWCLGAQVGIVKPLPHAEPALGSAAAK